MQFFASISDSNNVHIEADGIDVTYEEGFLDPSEAESYYKALQHEADWHRPRMTFAGIERVTARQVAWHGDEGVTYSYSGQQHRSMGWTPAMETLRQKVQMRLGIQFNGVLLNWYANGSEHVSPHSDDETDMEAGVPIAAISLGAIRDFVLKHKITRERFVLPLSSGSLVVMAGETQKVAVHSIPKRTFCREGRISLTFRRSTRIVTKDS
jgi:alkylated DNA repair dioxygenase AlkB